MGSASVWSSFSPVVSGHAVPESTLKNLPNFIDIVTIRQWQP